MLKVVPLDYDPNSDPEDYYWDLGDELDCFADKLRDCADLIDEDVAA